MAKEADRERLRRLRRALKAARSNERTSTRRARQLCTHARQSFTQWKRAAKVKLRAEIAALREQARTWPREQKALLGVELERRKEEVCRICDHGVDAARKAGAAETRAARASLAEEQERRKRERIWSDRGPKLTGAARAHEARQESDSDVRANLSPDELVIWERVSGRIKPSPRMTRTEAFHHWMHEHSGELAAMLEEQAQRDVSELVRRESELRAQMAKPYSVRPVEDLRRAASSGLDAVPF